MALNIKPQNIPTLEESMSGLLFGSTSVKENNAQNIEIKNLVPFSNQPFKLYSEEKLKELSEDIKINGILSPIIVRPIPTEENKYQILAGHNRVNAARLAGLRYVPCIVKDVDDIKANLILVNSNLNQRQDLLPSEKALSYKIQQDNLVKLNGTSCPTVNIIAQANDTNRKDIYRYLRLAELPIEMLDMVDEKTISITDGVNFSYLPLRSQKLIVSFIVEHDIKKVATKQADEICRISNLVDKDLNNIFFSPVEKKEGKKVVIRKETFDKYFDSNYTKKEINEIIEKALKKYFE